MRPSRLSMLAAQELRHRHRRAPKPNALKTLIFRAAPQSPATERAPSIRPQPQRGSEPLRAGCPRCPCIPPSTEPEPKIPRHPHSHGHLRHAPAPREQQQQQQPPPPLLAATSEIICTSSERLLPRRSSTFLPHFGRRCVEPEPWSRWLWALPTERIQKTLRLFRKQLAAARRKMVFSNG